jgi:localization factor PodJL
LRGPSRIILWGAASAAALALAGGAWFVKHQQAEPSGGPSPAAPEPDSLAPTEAPPPATPYDTHGAASPFGAEAPPESAPATGATEGGAPVAEPESAMRPTAALPSGVTATSAHPNARPGAIVAGPLAPRGVSLEQAAQNGDTVAQYELALQRISARRTGEGVQLLRNAANRGLAMAQYRLGKLYERGEGVPADLTMARQWTERAAGAGNRRAMHDLGVYFARGEGATLDEAAAFRWFRQAAELGVADSQYNLGVLYQQGRGVGASPSEAMFWFLVAARQGDEDAAARADALQAQLQPMQVEQSRARAQAFRPRAASAVANGEFGARSWSSAAPARPAT